MRWKAIKIGQKTGQIWSQFGFYFWYVFRRF